MQTLKISDRLPGLNDYTDKININRNVGNAFKRDTEELIMWQIKAQHLNPIEKPCKMTFYWVETNKKRDLDNIYSAKKYILDAMQKAGILKNDNQKWVTDLIDIHPIVDKIGGVVVRIEEEI